MLLRVSRFFKGDVNEGWCALVHSLIKSSPALKVFVLR